jgi:hypothetical protein
MVKFNLKEKEYILNDYLTIEQYVKIFKVKDLFTDQYFAAKLLNLVTEIPLEEVMKCDYEEINYLSSYILTLIPLEKNVPFIDRFELDGVDYGFFPNWRDLTFAEFVDIDTISTKKPEEVLNMLHILAAIMYRPIDHEISEHNFLIEEYDVKTMVPRSELFKKKLDVKYILGGMFFFINFAKKYSLFSQASSTQMTWKMKVKILWKMRKLILQAIFKKRTDGILQSTELLETILTSTTTSTKKT